MKKIVLSESSYDYKYKNIFGRIPDVEVIDGKFLKLLKILARKKSYYHIRYIKYRGVFLTPVRIILVYFLSKISGSKIIWSCHNIYEHNIPSKRFNGIIRILLCAVSSKIIVFHKDLIAYLPKFSRKKVLIASFGEFQSFIENRKVENEKFWNEYQNWLNKRKIARPDIISVSAARRNNLHLFINKIKYTNLNALIIAPNYIIDKTYLSKNTFLYNDDFVEKEVYDILKNSGKIIGFIGHENISVPTSIYMFASFGIPVIGLNIKPVSTIIKEYSIGEIIDEKISFDDVTKKIIANFNYYSQNCSVFLQENNWEKSAEVHKELFQ